MMRYLYNEQKGKCPVCGHRMDAKTGWNIHHLLPKHLGGRWIVENLVILHPFCHIQVHQNEFKATALQESVKKA